MVNEQNNNTQVRLIAGIILILLGVLFLLDNYNIIDLIIPRFLLQWEFIPIGIGVYLYTSSRNKTAAIILIAIGLFNLAPQFWPLLLVGLGIYIILKRNKVTPQNLSEEIKKDGIGLSNKTTDSEFYSIDDVSIFGGGTKFFTSNNFKGGKLTAIFGGSDIHLENCGLSEGKNIIDVFAMFGGYTIFVPQDWNIIVDVIPIFGGFSDKRIKDPNRVYDNNKVLIFKGMVLFGGAEIKFY